MRNTAKALALVMVTAVTSMSLPPSVDAGSAHHGPRYYYRPYRLHYYGFHHSYRYGYHDGPYGYGGPYSYGHGVELYDLGAVRIEVTPKSSRKQTQVYVNGAHVGAADDFDGVFQRLHLRPGEYEIELRLEGYRTFRERIFVSPGRTYNIRHRLEPLAGREGGPREDAPGDRDR